jgi:hypothetical protein
MEPASSISLSTLAKPLIAIGSSLGKAVIPHLRQLHAERQAGRESTAVHTNFIDASLEATLSRLQQIEGNDSWWRELLQSAEIAYVRPDYLAKPSVREWLSEVAVRDDLKALARGKLLPGSPDEAPSYGCPAAIFLDTSVTLCRRQVHQTREWSHRSPQSPLLTFLLIDTSINNR